MFHFESRNNQEPTNSPPALLQNEEQPTLKNKTSLPQESKKKKWRLTTVAVWWRNFHPWLNTVFIRRKEYVPGDTCRFIWQTVPEVKRSFVYYRVWHLIANIFVFTISFFHIFIPYKKNLCENEPLALCFGPFRVQYEWFFYATSSGITVNTVQSIWAMVLTLQFYLRQKKERNQDMVKHTEVSRALKASSPKPENSTNQTKDSVPVLQSGADSATKEHKILSRTGFYWGLHSYALCASVVIDIIYWSFLWPKISGKISNKFFNELNEHAFNFLLTASDYCVVAFPVIFTHISFAILISYLYLIVTCIYYIAGGKNEEHTRRYIYAFLNWEHPGSALLYGSAVALLTSIILLILLLIDHYKFNRRPQMLSNQSRSTSL